MRTERSIGWICLFVLWAAIASCGHKPPEKKSLPDTTPKHGTIYISVDESFRPVIEEEIKVYESSFPETHIIASYKSESNCWRDLQGDSNSMVIVARPPTKEEVSFFENKLSFHPYYDILAYDAVAAIVNIHSADSVFTLAKLKDILSGKNNTTALMDGNNSTSTVRYLQDSILHGGKFGKNVVATQGDDSVINIISNSPGAIGFVGLSWVGNSDDPKQLANLEKIRLALVECVTCEEKGYFAKPSQATLTYGQYPLARPLYCIVKDNASGLGAGFMAFMGLERGQLIFRRSYLVPGKINFLRRNVIPG